MPRIKELTLVLIAVHIIILDNETVITLDLNPGLVRDKRFLDVGYRIRIISSLDYILLLYSNTDEISTTMMKILLKLYYYYCYYY